MSSKKLAVIVLGNRNSGKSSTWYSLFGRTIRTGYKKLHLDGSEISLYLKNSSFEETGVNVDAGVFVRNASFEEWGDVPEDFFDEDDMPRIVLCAVQYKEKGKETINFFVKHDYELYIQWLNPGYRDGSQYEDFLGFERDFKAFGEFHIVDGKEKEKRVSSIKTYLYKWLENNR